MTAFVRALTEVGIDDAAAVGRKAGALGDLSRAGFPVPGGFVVTTEAMRRVLAAADLPDMPTQEQVAGVEYPEDVLAALAEVAGELGDTPVAVRSSGVAEDMQGMSFAGQYDTVLDVRGREALLDAVRTCWGSAYAERVTTYQDKRELDRTVQMAVLVQRMVPADAAGVAFSANPVTGRRDEVVVSAVRGLGERLVSGQATPDEWVFRHDELLRSTTPEQSMGKADALRIAELARAVEAHYRAPQDIEWALHDGKVWLLQARPITALPEPLPDPVPVTVVAPRGHWSKNSFFTRPVSPMQRSLFLGALNSAMNHQFDYAIGGELTIKELGSWLYVHMDFGQDDDKQRGEPSPFVKAMLKSLLPLAIGVGARLDSKQRARLNRIIQDFKNDKRIRVVQSWHDKEAPDLTRRITELRTVELGGLSDDALVEHFETVHKLGEETLDLHFYGASESGYVQCELGVFCRDVLGWPAEKVLQLLVGLPSKTTEPSLKLSELAQVARQRPAVVEFLETMGKDGVAGLEKVDAEFAARFDSYLHDYGRRVMNLYITEPTLAEQPALAAALLRDQVRQEFDQEARTAELVGERNIKLAEAHELLDKRSADDRAEFDRLVQRAQLAFPVRDDSGYLTMQSWALARYAVQEVGARLRERGLSSRDPDSVFLLERDEAIKALVAGGDVTELVTRRLAERLWLAENPPPRSFGIRPVSPVTPVDAVKYLPAEYRYIHLELLGWAAEASGMDFASGDFEPKSGSTDGNLTGVAASRGRYTGPVRVIRDVSEFGRLQPGDVLVCPDTSAQWSVLFPNVGALVTDQGMGGMLSHPAIIAREYNVPAVVGTGNATERLADGQLVTVDGGSGEVELVDAPA
jgi:phosphohistidine swiveling domain-containing protein